MSTVPSTPTPITEAAGSGALLSLTEAAVVPHALKAVIDRYLVKTAAII